MTSKTRKRIWPVVLMSLGVFGLLAAAVAFSTGQPQTVQADDPCADLDGQARFDCVRAEVAAGHNVNDPDHTHETEPTPMPTPVVVTENDASEPVMFQAEGLDNGARLNWRQPKLRAPGATVIGYEVHRDAWNANPDHPINHSGDDEFYLFHLDSVLAVDHHDRGLAYNTAYTYWVRAVVEYNLQYWWDNLDCGEMNAVVDPRSGDPTVASGAYCHLYKNLSAEAKPVVQRAYNLQGGKAPFAMVDTWWNDLNCMEMNEAVSPEANEPQVGSNDPDNDPRSPYCYMYDDLSPAAAAVVRDAHYNDYGRYRHGSFSSPRTIMTSTSGGLLNALLAPPSAPVPVDATPSCDDQIMVTWKEPADLGKVPSNFTGCTTCGTNETPRHRGGDDAGIEILSGDPMITSYKVERRKGNGPWMTVAHDLPGTARYWTDDDEDLAYGMTYHYRVSATNNANLTGPAGMVTVPLTEQQAPLVPTSPDADPIAAVDGKAAHVLVTWDPPGTAAGTDAWRTESDVDTENGNVSKTMSYIIQRQTVGSAGWETLATKAHQYLPTAANAEEAIDNVQTQEHEDIPPSGTYKYRVSAQVHMCARSEWVVTAEEVQFTTVPPALGDASSLTAAASASAGVVILEWNAAANAGVHWVAGIPRADLPTTDRSRVIWTQADGNSRHVVTGLESGVEYVFTVIGGRNENGPWGIWTALAPVTPN